MSFPQPHSASGSAAHLVKLEGPDQIPLGGTIDLRLTGTVMLSTTDIATGFKTFTLTIYDDDPVFDDPLQSVTVTVPAANGKAGMYTPFYVVTTLSNVNHVVVGPLGSSGQQNPWIYFVTPDGTYSADIQVFAE
ncbi:MAG: hypothetical protein L0211_07605 [Planctomycetaceae bacterium]|nr:hypothetical protein [Planctomycetaceae bacterium]